MMPPSGADISFSSSPNPGSRILAPGEEFGEFKVMKCLSQGLSGDLYIFHHGVLDALHTVLVLPEAVSEDPKFAQRFCDFGEKLLHLEHPHLLSLQRYDMVNERFCLFYEGFDGETVEALFEDINRHHQGVEQSKRVTRQPFPPEAPGAGAGEAGGGHAGTSHSSGPAHMAALEVASILKQAGQGLRAAHDSGVHHYGMELGHLLRNPEGVVKLCGVGVQEMLGEELFSRIASIGIPPLRSGARRQLSDPLVTVSPEQRRGSRRDARADLYALGVIGYFLLTGRRPAAEYIPPRQLIPNLPEHWNGVIGKCLEPDPNYRYASAGAFLADMEPLAPGNVAQKGRGGKGRPGGFARRWSDLPPKRARVLRLCALGLAALVLVGIARVSYLVLLADPPDPVSPVRRVSGSEVPSYLLELRPSNVVLVIQGSSERIFINQGRAELLVSPGTHGVRVESPGFRPRQLQLEGSARQRTLEVSLDPDWASLEVRTRPGAAVAVVGATGLRHLGTAGPDGRLVAERRLFGRPYVFQVSLPGHEVYRSEETVLRGDRATVLEAELAPLPARILVTSRPPGARIMVDGEDRGTTPHWVEDLTVFDPMSVQVTHPEFHPRTFQVRLRPGQEGTLDFGDLDPRVGYLELRTTFLGVPMREVDQRRLMVSVDGALETWETLAQRPVRIGRRELVVEHPDFLPWVSAVNVVEGETLRLMAELSPKPAELTLVLEPDLPFELVVDGSVVSGTGNVFSLTPGRDQMVEIRVRDHLSLRRPFLLRPNEKQTWTASLTRIPPPQQQADWVIPYVGLNMVWVEPGSFTMGSPPPEQGRLPNEGDVNGRPVPATLTRGFWVAVHETTQLAYSTVTGTNPSRNQGPSHPVEQVSWLDAMDFCRRLSENEQRAGRLPEGYVYRLPTQAEWEYAARAGTQTPFSWGSVADGTRGNFSGHYPRQAATGATGVREVYGTVPVGSYQPNPWGLYDVHGNVREWCLDFYSERYPRERVVDWVESAAAPGRPVRGGGWQDPAVRCRSASRDRMNASTVSDAVGFRVVLAPAVPGFGWK